MKLSRNIGTMVISTSVRRSGAASLHMIASQGVLTSEGGATSHAAVVARQFGIPCVVGASVIKIDLEKRVMNVGEMTLKEGDWISVDGTTGKVFAGKIPSVEPKLEEGLALVPLALRRLQQLVGGSIGSPEAIRQSLVQATPILIAGLGVSF